MSDAEVTETPENISSLDEPLEEVPPPDEPLAEVPPVHGRNSRGRNSRDRNSRDRNSLTEGTPDEPMLAEVPPPDEPSAEVPPPDEPSAEVPPPDEPSADFPPPDEPSAEVPPPDEPSAEVQRVPRNSRGRNSRDRNSLTEGVPDEPVLAEVPQPDEPAAVAAPDEPSTEAGAEVVKAKTSITGGPAQFTRSYVFVDSEDASIMYEKDGDWVLGKTPPYTKDQMKNSKGKDSEGSFSSDDNNANGVRGRVDPMLACIDALTSHETVPCNRCDNPVILSVGGTDIAPLWNWVYKMIIQISERVKEYKRDMEVRDVSCGESELEDADVGSQLEAPVEAALVSDKGTQFLSDNIEE